MKITKHDIFSSPRFRSLEFIWMVFFQLFLSTDMHSFILDNNIVFSVENQPISAKKGPNSWKSWKTCFSSIFTVKFAKNGLEIPEIDFKVQNSSNFIYLNDVEGIYRINRKLFWKITVFDHFPTFEGWILICLWFSIKNPIFGQWL